MTGGDVAVTGLGLVTPAGVGVTRTWHHLLSGESTAATAAHLSGLPVDLACQVPGFDAAALLGRRRAWRLDRHVQFALVAAEEALRDAGLTPSCWDPDRVAVVIGTGLSGTTTTEEQHGGFIQRGPGAVSPLTLPMTLPNMAAAQISVDYGIQGPVFSVSTACASGATAIGTALALLRSGAVDVAVAGGTDAAVTPYTISAFARMKALSRRCGHPAAASRPFDRDRDGFVLGEGAGVVVLETLRHAQSRSATVHATFAGYGATSDAHHVTAPHPEGRGVQQAIRTALADAGMSPSDIDHVNAHGTSTPQGDLAEARALQETMPPDTPVTSLKGTIGHCLAAAGAIEAVTAVLCLRHQRIPPTANFRTPDPAIKLDVVDRALERPLTCVLSNSFGFGGHNTALIVRR